MRSPQVVVCAPDSWIANQVRELAHDRKVLLHEVRQVPAARKLLEEGRISVLVLQVEVASVSTSALALVRDMSSHQPDCSVVIVIDTKLNEADQVTWTAALFDLGAHLVLLPPLTRTTLEDAVGGLLEATMLRAQNPNEDAE